MSIEPLNIDTPEIVVTGLNFRTAGLSLREQFAISEESVEAVLANVRQRTLSSEAILVSTCNRLEVITAKVAGQAAKNEEIFTPDVFPNVSNNLLGKDVEPYVYRKCGLSAAHHVFSVASGVDSLVVGETQITGQMKRSLEAAQSIGSAKVMLGRLFSMAFATAKKVRSSTSIGEGSVSVSSVARELAEQIFDSLQDASVLIFGAGEIGELTLRHLHAAGVKKFFIANRSESRAVDVAQRVDGAVLSLDQVGNFLPDVDIVIGASWRGAQDPYYLDTEAVKRSLEARNYKPQFLIDLAVPRNFDESINDLSDAFLYNVDDLQQIVSENQQERIQAAQQAKAIIEIEANKFLYWMNFRKLSPLLEQLQAQQVFRQPEMWQLMKRLRQTPLDTLHCEQLIDTLSAVVANPSHIKNSHQVHEAIQRCLSIRS